MRFKLSVILLLSLISISCSDTPKQPDLKLDVPEDSPQKVKDIWASGWPKVLNTCPGLNKYASALTQERVRDNLSYAPDHAKRVTAEFKIPQDDRTIPYMVNGHTCQFEISEDEKYLLIPKSACQELCFDIKDYGIKDRSKTLLKE